MKALFVFLFLIIVGSWFESRADVDVRRYNIVVRYIDASTGETIKEVRSTVPLTLEECDQALQPEVRGVVKAEDGIAEFVYCAREDEVRT